MSTSAEKAPRRARRPNRSPRVVRDHVSRRFVLTVGAPGAERQEVDRYRTKAEAVAAFAPWEARGLTGQVRSVSGPRIALDLPIDPNAPKPPRKQREAPKGPIVAPNVEQNEAGAAIMVTAWGETRNLHEWTADHRAKVGYGTIRTRLARPGRWSPERAISTPPADNAVRTLNREKAPKYEAFGESKTLNDWAGDARCATSAFTLRRRLRQGVPLELALGRKTPSAWRKIGRDHEAFGEAKSLTQWARDPRCRVGYPALVSRLKGGMSLADAISGRDPRAVEAFGESKTVPQWARDPRCVVSGQTLRNRMEAGVSLESALTASKVMSKPRLREAFGEAKTLDKWLHDPRCQASYPTVRSRLDAGVPFEMAIGRAVSTRATHERTAFGETRTLNEWAKDARCVVPHETLFTRLRAGMPLESALTQPHPSSIRAGAPKAASAPGS